MFRQLFVAALALLLATGGKYAHAQTPIVADGKCGEQDLVQVRLTELSPGEELADIHWLSSSKVAFVLTTHPGHVVLRSEDNGMSWASQDQLMPGADQVVSWTSASGVETRVKGVQQLYFSPADEKVIYFLGWGGFLWVTKDAGAAGLYSTAVDSSSNRDILELLPHPTQPGWVMSYEVSPKCRRDVNDPNPCYAYSQISKDYGATWQLLDTYVTRISWGNAGATGVPETTAWLLSHKTKSGSQRLLSPYDVDLYHTETLKIEDSHQPLDFVVNYVYSYGVHYVVQADPTRGVTLQTSEDNGKSWNIAEFPYHDLQAATGYWIFNEGSDSTFIAVRHGSYPSYRLNLYFSDALNKKFKLSLAALAYDRILGIPEFNGLQGLRGIMIANKYNSINPLDDLQSRYSTNGDTWIPLRAPQDGSTCTDPAGCFLQLHGNPRFHTENYPPYGPLHSTADALGLVLATGNVGSELSTDIGRTQTYFSNDAGATFRRILPFSTVYDFADHGGIMLFGQVGLSNGSTDLYYTWDEGATVKSCSLGGTLPQSLYISNVLAKPGGNTQEFLVHGTIPDSQRSVIMHVDMTGLGRQPCSESDYVLWTPGCIAGSIINYKRRKPTASCVADPVSVVSEYPCFCTEEDWECDKCFARDTQNICVNIDSSCIEQTTPCVPGTSYNVSSGYRLKASTNCRQAPPSKAVTHYPTMKQCPGGTGAPTQPVATSSAGPGSGGMSAGIVILIIFVVVAVLGGAGALWWFKVRTHPAGFAGFVGDLQAHVNRSSSGGARFEALAQDDGSEYGGTALDDDLLEDDAPAPLQDADLDVEGARSNDLLG